MYMYVNDFLFLKKKTEREREKKNMGRVSVIGSRAGKRKKGQTERLAERRAVRPEQGRDIHTKKKKGAVEREYRYISRSIQELIASPREKQGNEEKRPARPSC